MSEQTMQHRHTREIKERFPAPLSYMLIELAEMNRDKWLDGEDWRRKTIGAEDVMKYGLTENQRRFANQIAEQMEVDHVAYR